MDDDDDDDDEDDDDEDDDDGVRNEDQHQLLLPLQYWTGLKPKKKEKNF